MGKLASVVSSAEEPCDAPEAFLGGCCSTPLLREALQDPESYVRASAISALAQTLAHSWQQGAALTQEQVGRNYFKITERNLLQCRILRLRV